MCELGGSLLRSMERGKLFFFIGGYNTYNQSSGLSIRNQFYFSLIHCVIVLLRLTTQSRRTFAEDSKKTGDYSHFLKHNNLFNGSDSPYQKH